MSHRERAGLTYTQWVDTVDAVGVRPLMSHPGVRRDDCDISLQVYDSHSLDHQECGFGHDRVSCFFDVLPELYPGA